MLSCYRILDLTDDKAFICGRALSDFGAEVIKIEKPGGDPGHPAPTKADAVAAPSVRRPAPADCWRRRSPWWQLALVAGAHDTRGAAGRASGLPQMGTGPDGPHPEAWSRGGRVSGAYQPAPRAHCAMQFSCMVDQIAAAVAWAPAAVGRMCSGSMYSA